MKDGFLATYWDVDSRKNHAGRIKEQVANVWQELHYASQFDLTLMLLKTAVRSATGI